MRLTPRACVKLADVRDGKTHHRTVINLGRRDLLATHLDLGKLDRLLHGDTR